MTISTGIIATSGYLTGNIVDRKTLTVGSIGQVAVPDRSV